MLFNNELYEKPVAEGVWKKILSFAKNVQRLMQNSKLHFWFALLIVIECNSSV